jgi:hypothetical protein
VLNPLLMKPEIKTGVEELTTTIGVEHAWASIDQEAEDDVV